MNNKIIAKSERSLTNRIIIFLGIILFSFFIFLLNNNFQPKNNYEENLKLLGFFVLVSVIFYCFYYLVNQKQIYVYENYFEIKKLFQTQKYNYSEIITQFSEHFDGKYNSWTEYYLILKNGKKITLIDTEYSNFHSFYSKIEKRVRVSEELNAKLSEPKFFIYSIICGIVGILIFYFSSFFYDFKKIENNDFVYFTNKLKNEITLVKGRKGKNHFVIQLTDFSNYEFKISGRNYDGIFDKNEFLKTFKSGDIITIGLNKDDYDKKISKKKELNLLDKYLNFSVIQIKQIMNKQNKPLINLEEVNRLHLQNNYIGIGLFSFFGLFFFYLTYGNYIAYTKTLNQTTNKIHT